MRVGFAESELASGDFTTVLASTVPMSALALQCKMLRELALSRLNGLELLLDAEVVVEICIYPLLVRKQTEKQI